MKYFLKLISCAITTRVLCQNGRTDTSIGVRADSDLKCSGTDQINMHVDTLLAENIFHWPEFWLDIEGKFWNNSTQNLTKISFNKDHVGWAAYLTGFSNICVGFLHVLNFPPTVYKLASRWIGYSLCNSSTLFRTISCPIVQDDPNTNSINDWVITCSSCQIKQWRWWVSSSCSAMHHRLIALQLVSCCHSK